MPPLPRADVAIISGSTSDAHIVEKVVKVLEEHHVPYEQHVISAHRNPDKLDAYLRESNAKIFIAIAGMSAALPGVIAAKTDKPVIGVPVSGKLGGMDALLSISQMPKGVPVACVAVDGGENAALLAVRILKLIRPP
jgi:5-(carboxyamino)imidazole ribonucleotide mutase